MGNSEIDRKVESERRRKRGREDLKGDGETEWQGNKEGQERRKRL